MKQITILGMGPGDPALLPVKAMQALEGADLVIGAPRLLEVLPEGGAARRCVVAVRTDEILKNLENETWERACVAMSGDIGLFSGAKGLLAALQGQDVYKVETVPGISTVQYFAAQLQRPWQGWRCASAHGVACDIVAEVRKGGALFVVACGVNTVDGLCRLLCEAGMGEVQVTVGERLSYPDERLYTGTAEQLAGRQFDALSAMLVEPYEKAPLWQWANSGIADEAFLRGNVPMTKQEVRAVALAKLKVRPEDVVYDIGAGTGSVSVELALLARQGSAYAIERFEEAVALIEKNAAGFGVRNLHIVAGEAPEALRGLPAPQAVFIGGSGGRLADILAHVKKQSPGVRVCVACITMETLTEATRLLAGEEYKAFEVCQVAVARTARVGGYDMLKGLNPVFLVSAEGAEEC